MPPPNAGDQLPGYKRIVNYWDESFGSNFQDLLVSPSILQMNTKKARDTPMPGRYIVAELELAARSPASSSISQDHRFFSKQKEPLYVTSGLEENE